MSEQVEFESLIEIVTLLRAGVELKFELADDEDVLVGSPIYASALNKLRDGLISGYLSSFMAGKARDCVDWYRLDRQRDRRSLIARRASLDPQWKRLSEHDMREWVETLAAPFVVDDDTFAVIKAAADEYICRAEGSAGAD